MNARLTWLAMLQIIIYCMQRYFHSFAEETEEYKPSCVIEFRDYLEDNLTITWDIPAYISYQNRTIIPIIVWSTELNTGNCSEVTLISCVCFYDDPGCMDSDSVFNLTVILIDVAANTEPPFTASWKIDSENCWKPPQISWVNVTAVSSACLNVVWKCYDPLWFDGVMYRITYRRTDGNGVRKILECGPDCRTNCTDGVNICNLHPFTTYNVVVQTRLFNWQDKLTGHWSDYRMGSATTNEDVPSGAPYMIPGGFTVLKNECKLSGKKYTRLFWQEVNKEQQNGVITQYQMSILNVKNSNKKTVSVNANLWFYDVTLRCDADYDVTLRARTRAGFSQRVSTTRLKSIREIRENIIIIPELYKNQTMINVTIQHNVAKTGQYLVWCLADPKTACKYPLEWKIITSLWESLTIRTQHTSSPLDDMKVGITYADTGITWAPCLFMASEEIPRPNNLHAIPSLLGHDVEIAWEGTHCNAGQIRPFVDSYEVHVCETKHRYSPACIGPSLTFVVDGRSHSFIIPDLEELSVYKVSVVAVGLRGAKSDKTENIYVQPQNTGTLWTSPVFKILISAVAVIVLLSFICWTRNMYRKRWAHYKSLNEIEVPRISETHV